MPELPEVEITRRHLVSALRGRTLVSVSVTHPRTARRNNGDLRMVEDRLVGKTVGDVNRRGKFLLMPVGSDLTLVAHLGMSGRFVVGSPDDEPPKHTHFTAILDDGTAVRFVDPRTFGFIAVLDEEEMAESGLGRIGPDAWEDPLSPEALASSLAGRTAPIKALLLDQRPISGLGNIYADEALFRAGIDPRTPASKIELPALERLLLAVREVLESAIDNGGTSLDDLAYLLPDGRAGENLTRLQVYGRDGERCLRCGEVIDRVIIRSRSTHFCPGCQVENV